MARFLLVVQVDGSLACRRHPCQRTVVEDVEEVKELAKEPQVGAAVCLSFISLFLSAARVYWRPSGLTEELLETEESQVSVEFS